MNLDFRQTALLRYLQSQSSIYFGKVLELRDTVVGWLSYIPATFPHYTSHTVDHSDEIVRQISNLLFTDGDHTQPIVHLSAVEAYVVAAAAYLHDAGMVASEQEKTDVMRSEDWQAWISGQGGGAKRWEQIQALRQGLTAAQVEVKDHLADLETRFLLAEFIRRTHPQRASRLIREQEGAFARFAFDNPLLLRTIADVCQSHGLKLYELDDHDRYPDRRDLFGEKANVRFLAILLRLGDLLDMSSDRACPLLLNAACPLPADSLAHWTQYSAITHFMVAPDKIEITAECGTQDEHRVLRDWCQWLADEVREAGIVMARAERHRTWCLPVVSMSETSGTIKIRPRADAKYRPVEWRFELDNEAVFQRLISDVYTSPFVFVRELIQNALDATRCQMFLDLKEQRSEVPAYPTQVDEAIRGRYAIRVSLSNVGVKNIHSGETEIRQTLSVEDFGIGMDSAIIQRFLLQVGRSYYTTDEFRRTYRFVPTSRFGIGFLSVFGASEHVTVDTYKPGSQQNDGPLRLTITGPRSYFLVERGQRRVSGTKVGVMLRESLAAGELTRFVSAWCRRVEFPVEVDDLGTCTVLTAERPEQFTYEIPDMTHEGATLAVRFFPIGRPGLEGEIYVFTRTTESGESWTDWSWARNTYPQRHPLAEPPSMPASVSCLHGIAMGTAHRGLPVQYGTLTDDYEGGNGEGPIAIRVDHRGDRTRVPLSRSRPSTLGRGRDPDTQLQSRIEELIRDHLDTTALASGSEGWLYRQRLIGSFRYSALDHALRPLFESMPFAVRVYSHGRAKLVSLVEVLQTTRVTVMVVNGEVDDTGFEKATGRRLTLDNDAMAFVSSDIARLSTLHRGRIFESRTPSLVRVLPGDQLAFDWSIDDRATAVKSQYGPISVIALPSKDTIGITAHRTSDTTYEHVFLNAEHPLVIWMNAIDTLSRDGSSGITRSQVATVRNLLAKSVQHYGYEANVLIDYLNEWRKWPGWPNELQPPEVVWSRHSARLLDTNQPMLDMTE